MTKNQIKKYIAEEITKRDKVFFDKLDRQNHKIYKLEEELLARTGRIKLPGKNET